MGAYKGKTQCGYCSAVPGEDHHPRCDEWMRNQKSLGFGGHYYYDHDASDAEYNWDEAVEDNYSENSFP